MPKFVDLTGQKIGRLTVISLADKGPRAWWNCKCDCGTEKVISSTLLRSGQIKSCGCFKRENDGKHCFKHGHAPSKGNPPSRTYRSWQCMKGRCTNSSYYAYERYGGRGIKFCDAWSDFSNFLSDMGVRPEGMELDRINNDGNYFKENCKWSTDSQNNRNRFDNHIIEFRGERKCIAEWAELTGLGWHTIYYRIYRFHWTIEKALTEPLHRFNKKPSGERGLELKP